MIFFCHIQLEDSMRIIAISRLVKDVKHWFNVLFFVELSQAAVNYSNSLFLVLQVGVVLLSSFLYLNLKNFRVFPKVDLQSTGFFLHATYLAANIFEIYLYCLFSSNIAATVIILQFHPNQYEK